ncbi:hypothetical protein GGI35DRAFT_345042 [Trichoderma velutinum]
MQSKTCNGSKCSHLFLCSVIFKALTVKHPILFSFLLQNTSHFFFWSFQTFSFSVARAVSSILCLLPRLYNFIAYTPCRSHFPSHIVGITWSFLLGCCKLSRCICCAESSSSTLSGPKPVPR